MGSGLFLGILLIREIPVFNANSVDPDQTPHYVASDLGLYCLQRFHLWDAKLKWVNIEMHFLFQNDIYSLSTR